ncbi:MAG TPA: HepT-like ribonuclease domain-containing protein [Thermoanaerobaculia bacterium]|nr:HepT-like ribonuclease domain-containing protein [Thermoanaerobaculia bacterium]
MKPDSVYLVHILECARRIHEDVAGGRDEFMSSHLIQDAVLRNLQVLAESTQRLSPDAKAQRPDIEWPRIAAFRNVLVHDYLGVDTDVVWRVVSEDLGILEQAVRGILEALGE